MKKFLSALIAFVCVFACTFSLTACGDNGNTGDNGDNTHTSHNWSKTYTNDGDQHYQTCDGCDEKQYSDHNYGTDGVCVCGKTKPNEHTSHNWSKTYTPDDARNQHYQTCDGCDEKQYSDHNYGADDTCVCGKKKPVTNVPAESVTLDKTEIELEIGDTETLTATVAPENATDKSVTYSVEPAGIVSVDNDGNVTAIDEGTAVITATTSNGKKATCNVTVTKPLTNADVLQFLNENVLIEAAKSCLNASWEVNESNVIDVTWYLTKDGDSIISTNLLFTYIRDEIDRYVTLCKVDFASPLTPKNIIDGATVTPTYTRICRINIDATIQGEHTDLTNAICDKLFGENEDATRYIIDEGQNSLDPTLNKSSLFTVIEVTDTEIKQKSIAITYADNDSELIANLADTTKYYTYGDDISHAITGTKLENNSDIL